MQTATSFSDTLATFENHESLYLPDGNVTLLAAATSASGKHHTFTVFRVHQSLLGRHSSVLKDMMSDIDVLEEHDGVPCIHMSDSAEEVECLLKYIYGDLTLPLRRLSPSDLAIIRHLLNLSNKYTIPSIRKQLLPRLEQDWPPTLFRWDALSVEIAGLFSLWNDDPQPSYFDDYLPEPASAIRLGFECNVPSILPAAFYHLSRLSIFQNRHDDLPSPWSSSSSGAAKQREDPDNFSRAQLSLRMANWHLLHPSDFITLLKGQHRLSDAANKMMFDEPRLCNLAKYHLFESGCSIDAQWDFWKDVKASWKHTKDVLQLLEDQGNQVQSRTKICETCRADIQKALRHMRKEIWSLLPKYFELVKSPV